VTSTQPNVSKHLKALQEVGLLTRRPLIQGFVLWVLMGSLTLGAIILGWLA